MTDQPSLSALRRTVLVVALLNFGYFFVEAGVAWSIGSVSLFADSVDFLEDTAVNLLIFVAIGWPLAHRAKAGKAMAVIIMVPAAAALWQAVTKFSNPEAPDPLSLMLTAGGAVVVNTVCAALLLRHRDHGGSMSKAAWLAARNDVVVNLGIIAMGVLTLTLVPNGWPDLILGLGIVVLNFHAAKEVWEVAEEENLAAKALRARWTTTDPAAQRDKQLQLRPARTTTQHPSRRHTQPVGPNQDHIALAVSAAADGGPRFTPLGSISGLSALPSLASCFHDGGWTVVAWDGESAPDLG